MLEVTYLENYQAGTRTNLSTSRLGSAWRSSRFPGESLALFFLWAGPGFRVRWWLWSRRACPPTPSLPHLLSPSGSTSTSQEHLPSSPSSSCPSFSLLKVFIHPWSSHGRNIIKHKLWFYSSVTMSISRVLVEDELSFILSYLLLLLGGYKTHIFL